MITETIVDKLFEEALGEGLNSLKQVLMDRRNNKLIVEIIQSIKKKISISFQDKMYWHELDGFLEMNGYSIYVLRLTFMPKQSESIASYSKNVAMRFLNDKKCYLPYQSEIIDLVKQYGYDIQKEVIKVCTNNSSSQLLLHLKDTLEESIDQNVILNQSINGMDKKLNRILSIMQGKEELRVKNDINYSGLYSIWKNDSMSLYEKEKSYIEWISQNKNEEEAMVYLADNCKQIGDYKRAIFYYKYVAQKNKKEYELYNNAGLIYKELNDIENAMDCFLNVVEVDPNNLNAGYNIAITCYESNQIDKAFASIMRAHERYPDDCDTSCFLAVLVMEFYPCPLYIEKVENLLRATLERNPENFYCNYNLGYALLFRKKFDEAIYILEKAKRLFDKEPLLFSLLGMVYAMRTVRNSKKAIENFELAYKYSNDENYLVNIEKLRNGYFFDSVLFNNKCYEIYTDQEVIELQRQGL